jgi:hypothetical protein
VPGLRVAAILAVTQSARVNDRGCATACLGKGFNYSSKRRLFPHSRKVEDSLSEVCANAAWFSSIKEDSVEEKVVAQNSRSHLSATEIERVASVGANARHANVNWNFCLKCKAIAYFALVVEHVA